MVVITYCKNIILFGLGALCVFLASELALSAITQTPLGKVWPLTTAELGESHPDLGYALKPNAAGMWTKENRSYVRINALGHRDKDVQLEKQPGTARILIFGDSMTEALQVENEKTFENLAENALQSQDYPVEIINLAMSGNGPLRQLLRLETHGIPLSPDIAVFKFSASDFLTGQLFDDSQNPAYKIDENKNISRSYNYKNRLSQRLMKHTLGRAFFSLIRYSHVVRALNQKRTEPVWDFINLSLPKWNNTLLSPAPPAIKNIKTCRAETFAPNHDLWVKHQPDHVWRATQQYLSDVASLTKQHHFKAIFMPHVALPQKDCAEEQRLRAETLNAMKNTFKPYNFIIVDDMFEISQTMGLEPYKSEEIENLHGFGLSYGSGHLNYTGHRIYAQQLERILKPYIKGQIQ